VVDDADRENEGDFIIAAERCTPEAVNFMVTHGRGIVCLPVAGWRLDELQIPQMVSSNGGDETAFTVSIDFAPSTTTGTSAFGPVGHRTRGRRPRHQTPGIPEARPRLPSSARRTAGCCGGRDTRRPAVDLTTLGRHVPGRRDLSR
jgi:hypothetical protein